VEFKNKPGGSRRKRGRSIQSFRPIYGAEEESGLVAQEGSEKKKGFLRGLQRGEKEPLTINHGGRCISGQLDGIVITTRAEEPGDKPGGKNVIKQEAVEGSKYLISKKIAESHIRRDGAGVGPGGDINSKWKVKPSMGRQLQNARQNKMHY